MNARPPASVSRLRRRRRTRLIRITLFLFGIFLLLCVGLVLLLRASFWRIKNVAVVGADAQTSAQIQQIAAADLSGNYLFVIPKNNTLLYPASVIAKNSLAALAQVKTISVSRKGFTAIQISSNERTPTAAWCGESPATSSPCLFLDQDGVAYGVSASTSDMQIYYGPLSPIGNSQLQQFLDPADFHSLSALTNTLAAMASDPITNVSLDDQGNISANFQNGFQLLFDVDEVERSAGNIVNAFSLALGSAPFQNHSLADFQYLDLRFGDKLYYKLKSGSEVEATSTE